MAQYTIMIKTFGEWLQIQLIERDWSQSELSRRAGLSRSAVNQYISGKNKVPNQEAVHGLSRALGLPVEAIYRAAGILPDLPNPRAQIEEALGYSVSGLTAEQLEEVLQFVEFIRARDKRQTSQNTLQRDGASHPKVFKPTV